MAHGLDWESARRRDLARKGDPEAETPRLKPAPPREPTPMSPKQRKYLKALCIKHSRSFDPTMSRRQASALITQLKLGRRTQPPARQ